MKKFLRKGIVWSLATVLATPVWLLMNFFNATSAQAAPSDPKTVVINEMMWMGSAASSDDEWIELYNTTLSPVDIGGWIIKNSTTSTKITLPAGEVIGAGGYYLISKFPEDSINSNLNVKPDFVTSSMSLANSPDRYYYLTDSHDAVIDTVDAAPTWPAGYYDGSGLVHSYYSMARKLTVADGENSSSWFTSDFARGFDTSSEHLGTPGSINGAEISTNVTPTGWTNDNVLATATADGGILNATSHVFTANGSFDFTVASDGGTASKTVTVTNIDKVAPMISGISGQTGTTGDAAIITANVSDSISGIASVQITFDEVTFEDMTLGTAPSYSYSKTLPSGSLMSIPFQIRAIDNAGNVADSAIESIAISDNDAPVIQSITSAPDTMGDVTTITVAGTDNIGIESAEININGAGFVPMLGSGPYTYPYTLSKYDGSVVTIVVRLTDAAGNVATSDNYTILPIDADKPVITLKGENPVSVILGNSYVDAGASALDNIDGNLTSKIVTTNNVDTKKAGTYYVTYNVTDSLGNKALEVKRTVVVAAIGVPVFNASLVEQNGTHYIEVTWSGVGGGADYEISINDKVWGTVIAKSDPAGQNYTQNFQAPDFGKYEVLVRAMKQGSYSANLEKKTVEYIAPTAVAPVSTTDANVPKAKVAPAPAPSAENKVETGKDDDQGKIKGTEESDENEENEGTNWTPWIILFVLIIFAGAVTGGYFYWFAGKDEIEEADKDIKKIKGEAKKVKTTVRAPEKKKKTKKPNRW